MAKRTSEPAAVEDLDLYPPAPAGVPADLARPSASYRLRAVVVLVCLFLFLLLYVLLVFSTAYLSYHAFASMGGGTDQVRTRTGRSSGNGVWLFILGLCSGLLCLFLVKGFFKRQRIDTSHQFEVNESEQPHLFAFIRRLCAETRAPLPHRVYLTAEVNAAVFYHQSFLALFLPARKNLLVGLGLINRLNLSEFKAVLAHEFGHFSQNSMKIGSYVYTSNRIIGDLVFGRDWLDDAVAGLQRTDIRIAVFAWAFAGVLWGIRKTLQGVFRMINFANAALSRQMEFNADLVSVSVTGSDALIYGLAKLDFANDTLMQAWNDLSAAADHNIYSRDLFYHQTHAADFVRALRHEPNLGIAPALPERRDEVIHLFKPEDVSVPKMWATHPSNYDREVNAKRRYIRSEIDERSPWMLFDYAADVREDVTRRLYKIARHVERVDFQDPARVQAFIDDEHAETTYHPRYQGLYDNRYLTPGDVEQAFGEQPAEYADAEKLAEAHAGLIDEDLTARMKAHRTRQQELNKLFGLALGAVELTGKDFEFRGSRFAASAAKELIERVQKEIDQDFNWFGELDWRSLRVHHEMARQLGGPYRGDLINRYRFHIALQGIHGQLVAQTNQVQGRLSQLAGMRNVDQGQFQALIGTLRQAQATLAQCLDSAHRLYIPALKNMTANEKLGPFLSTLVQVSELSGAERSIDGQWIEAFLRQMGEVTAKVARIHFKSLGGILALQDSIAEKWKAQQTAPTA